jgi:hypothetical protein
LRTRSTTSVRPSTAYVERKEANGRSRLTESGARAFMPSGISMRARYVISSWSPSVVTASPSRACGSSNLGRGTHSVQSFSKVFDVIVCSTA